MGNSINELFYQTISEFQPCECCRIRYSSTTCTTSTPHKWTEEEIKGRILELGQEIAFAKWWNRGDLRRQLRHWTEKLDKFRYAKENFNLTP